LRAAKMAGLRDIPAYVRKANDQQLLELALLENLQREDLNAIEIALGYKRMMDELDLTQELVAENMGKDRSTVTNYIRLLKLPPDIQVAVRSGEITMGHARALINVDTVEKQIYIFNEIKNKGLSVRQTEALVRNLYKQLWGVKKTAKSALPQGFQKIEDKLASHFSTRVKLKHTHNGSGHINIEYYSVEELNNILRKMDISAD
jgi:ParB family chromosome partitioning protein